MSYAKYIVWMRLTRNGRRSREEMSPEAQAEYDSMGFRRRSMWDEPSAIDHEAARRAYEEITGGRVGATEPRGVGDSASGGSPQRRI